eukprot:2857077-Rhodomonas_salina.1
MRIDHNTTGADAACLAARGSPLGDTTSTKQRPGPGGRPVRASPSSRGSDALWPGPSSPCRPDRAARRRWLATTLDRTFGVECSRLTTGLRICAGGQEPACVGGAEPGEPAPHAPTARAGQPGCLPAHMRCDAPT